MDNIFILDDNTINKIAAGEVIERPSSIVKELVENSIDAESTAITIEIKDGGTSYIRVTDNGKGMSPRDAKISFERHATSKIGSSKDLEKILTLGFRGEALASIAAVTQMELITRERDSLSGSQIVNHGGDFKAEREIGCPEGTTVIVRNLFFNTPARLKFLKSIRTETAYISDLVARLILAHPEISFRYINNGKNVYFSTGDGDLRNAILSIYGKDVVEQIIPIKAIDNLIDLEICGYLGKPPLARRNRTHQSFFVNGRYIKSALLQESVESAYRPYLTVNLFPWVVLNIGIAPDRVDVNVHPSKTEIRFKDGEDISRSIEHHIGVILKKQPYVPLLKDKSFSPLPKRNGEGENSEQLEAFSPISLLMSREDDEDGQDIFIQGDKVKEEIMFQSNSIEEPQDKKDSKQGMNHNISANNRNIEFSASLKIVGKIFTTYIIVESEKECFLIDQHAAHERLLFERYKEMLSKRAIATQQLLPPVIIEVTHTEQVILDESIELFHSLGFEIEPFGGRSFAVRGVPVILGSSNINEFFHELLDRRKEFVQGYNYKLKMDDIIQMSCKKAVKAGDNLSDIEIIELLNGLMKKEIPMTCPHGRPIMISITRNELEKMFRRIQ